MTDLDQFVATTTAEADAKDRKIHELQRKARDAKRAQKAAIEELEDANRRLQIALGTKSIRPLPPIVPREMGGGRPEATASLSVSDFHYEEEIRPETVDGKNEATPEILESRWRSMFEGAAYWVRQYANVYHLRDMLIWFGGDLVTGNIHTELIEGASMSPIQAMMGVQNLAAEGLRYMLEQTELEQIQVMCSHGNHDRMTVKPRVATQAVNSLSFMMYHHLADHFRDEPRLAFGIANGAHIYHEVYGRTLGFHHGDHIGYQGGVGGITIPLRKKIDAWNTVRRAHLWYIAHWHQFLDLDYALLNGSLIGYSPFSMRIGARYEPPRQAFCLLDKRRWKRHVTPIYVSDHSARERALAAGAK